MVETIFKFATVVADAVVKGIEYNQLKQYCLDCVSELRKAATEIQRLNNICEKYSSQVKYLTDKVEQLENKGDR
jgi:peptidoglycan hydrolase CwlO-like protein